MDAFHTLAVIREHDGLATAQRQQQLAQRVKFVLAVGIDLINSDASGWLLFLFQHIEREGIVKPHIIRHHIKNGGRSQNATVQVRHLSEQLTHLVLKSQFQRFIHLVQHQQTGSAQVDVPALVMVKQAARGSNNHIRSYCQ